MFSYQRADTVRSVARLYESLLLLNPPPLFVSLIMRSSSLFCDDVNDYLDAPVPLGSDTVIELDDFGQLECPTPQSGSEELAEVLVRGGTLTLSSDNTVRYHSSKICQTECSKSEVCGAGLNLDIYMDGMFDERAHIRRLGKCEFGWVG